MAGYSGTPLVQKIGIKPGPRIILRNHPPTFLKALGKLPEGVQPSERLTGQAAMVVYFTDKRAESQHDFSLLSKTLLPDGMLWIAWPKKSVRTANRPERKHRPRRRTRLRAGGRESLRH